MRRTHLLALCVFTLGAAPGAAAGPASPGGSTPPQACPAASFPAFAEAFLKDGEIRQAFTRSTLIKTHLADAQPEPKRIATTVSAREALDLLEPAQRQRLGLAQVRVRQDPRPQIIINKPDTDYQLTYTFERASCWFLVRVDDDSL